MSSGTWANSGRLYVGWEGTGTLNVNGGLVTSGTGWIGYNAASVGTANVSSGTWASSGDLTVGLNGTGTLNVNGGNVTNAAGFLGSNAGSVGTATVSGGTWANSGNLTVGGSGTGTLTISGGSVTNTDGWIGYNAGGVGTATVSSGTWASGGRLYVGGNPDWFRRGGTGTLNVTGGSVTNTDGWIGVFADSVGTVNVSSGTWANSGDLVVGGGGDIYYVNGGGTGTLTMSGGLVLVAGTLSQGTFGTINLNSGGTLQIGTGGAGGVLGVDALTNNGTLIFNRSDASDYSGIISGTGAVTKQGGGTLTLSGNNSYTGGTTISGGVLQVGAGGTTGSIAGNVVNNSSLIFNRSDAKTFSGVISGAGAVTKQGLSTLTFEGNNSYSGGTTISAGVLQVGAGGTTGSIAGNVANSAAIIFNRSDASTYSGIISGTGAVTKQGGGTLTLSGNNSYTGGTTISDGVLQVGAGGTTGSIAGNVVNNSSLIFNRSDASIHSNFISGTGSIQNAGAGTTTLTGQTSFTNGLVATAGRLIVGSAASVNGFSTTGSLTAASGATLELKSRGLAYVNGLTTLTGGTILAANGISLGGGANVVGRGVISGDVSAVYGSWIEADGGKLTVGKTSSYVGFASDGRLYTNANEVELLDRNLAVLGSLTQLGDGSAGGTLRAANGMLLEQGKNLVGRGTVYGDFVNQGDVYGDGSAAGQVIVFAAGSTVSGIGSFENVVFDGTYSPGNSPAITNLTNGQFSSASSLLIELGGTQPGTQYDRVVDSGVLTLLGGTLNVALYNGFMPSLGDSFEILQYGQLSGDFGTVIYPTLSGGFSWARTTSATAMTITVVPEPSTYALLAIGAGIIGLTRRRRK